MNIEELLNDFSTGLKSDPLNISELSEELDIDEDEVLEKLLEIGLIREKFDIHTHQKTATKTKLGKLFEVKNGWNIVVSGIISNFYEEEIERKRYAPNVPPTDKTTSGQYIDSEEKTCKNCKTKKSVSYFYPSTRTSGGYTKWCKSCLEIYQNNQTETNTIA
ncbi:hypothetical protein [Microbulbifer agarilyticus]|uniref:hypothetical protein n=1 Tax=Microbulbifer agarilyticus TaxID=260552 RepID=UPI001CD7BB83|nr:hypothetical protein [Microbulbifer agarilyticus]MCA0899130.1 hypothetical protein [Microbulbifer agarilyticus]